jgi:hypothetical protein
MEKFTGDAIIILKGRFEHDYLVDNVVGKFTYKFYKLTNCSLMEQMESYLSGSSHTFQSWGLLGAGENLL